MNRLHKKCLIGSLVVHGVSLLVLLVGPALMPKKEALNIETIQLIDLSNISLTDGQTTGGGATAPAPALPVMSNPEPLPPIQQPVVEPPPLQPEPEPAPPVVKPQPKPVKQPDPEPEPVKPVVKNAEPVIPKDPPKNPKSKPETKPKETVKESPKDTTAKTENKPKLNNKDQIKVNLTQTKRNGTAAKNNNSDAEDKAREQAEAQDNARKIALANATGRITGGLSTSTSISIPGTGGEAFLNYGTAVVSIYEGRWTIPSNLAGGNNTVRAKVVIRKDGTVISADIVDKSGNAGVNQSVQRLLDSVRFIKAFPAGATDTQRVFYINFDPNKKRYSG